MTYYKYNVEDKILCSKCGNKDSKYVGSKNGILYCRKCITFQGEVVEYIPRKKGEIEYFLDFNLSKEQKEISHKVKENYLNGKNTLIHAVCGAGKTEIVYETIRVCLTTGGRVGFAIPRKDVVIELQPRISKAFKKQKVVSVYGGHRDELVGDIVILTTHQLYRYVNYFDLVIIDEVDAFPFQNNDILQTFFQKSLRSNYILMSATPSDQTLETFKNQEIVKLFKRFHGYKLPIPQFIKKYMPLQVVFLIRKLKTYENEQKYTLVFTPTIAICEKLYKILKLFFKSIDFVHSKRQKRKEIVEDFKIHNTTILVTTSVLERGITVPNLQVIVFQSDHRLYTHQVLTQIAGRVGRKSDYPDGDIYYLGEIETDEIKKSIQEIKTANEYM